MRQPTCAVVVATSVLLVASVRCSAAGLEDFAPFRPMLGSWTGVAEVQIEDAEGQRSVSYTKTSECRFDESRQALEVVDQDMDVWTGRPCKITAVIYKDHTSGNFKAMVHGDDGAVDLFVITANKKKLHYHLVDLSSDVTFRSTVTCRKDGTLLEKGSQVVEGDDPYTVRWTIRYERKEERTSAKD